MTQITDPGAYPPTPDMPIVRLWAEGSQVFPDLGDVPDPADVWVQLRTNVEAIIEREAYRNYPTLDIKAGSDQALRDRAEGVMTLKMMDRSMLQVDGASEGEFSAVSMDQASLALQSSQDQYGQPAEAIQDVLRYGADLMYSVARSRGAKSVVGMTVPSDRVAFLEVLQLNLQKVSHRHIRQVSTMFPAIIQDTLGRPPILRTPLKLAIGAPQLQVSRVDLSRSSPADEVAKWAATADAAVQREVDAVRERTTVREAEQAAEYAELRADQLADRARRDRQAYRHVVMGSLGTRR